MSNVRFRTCSMRKYTFFANHEQIGWSTLEYGDPPMGVAFGRFHPTQHYAPPHPDIEARTPEGVVIRSAGGVDILDGSAELGPEGIEVSILGIESPPYEELFPEHVAAYDAQFDRGT